MIPVIFINCSDRPYVDAIIAGTKEYETRNKNTLKALLEWALGKRVLIAETGHGVPVVRCSAVIDSITEVFSEEAWRQCIGDDVTTADSKYSWDPDTKKKVMYHLSDVRQVTPFIPEGRRHGRTWMECNNAPGDMSHSGRMETIALFIDTFEDFLEEKGIDIPNEERDEDPCGSLIYGTDYGVLSDKIEALLIRLGYLEEEV